MASKKTKWVGRECVQWVACKKARRVPNFVIDLTHMDSAVAIKAAYGDGAVFVKGEKAPPRISKKVAASMSVLRGKKSKA